MSKRDCFASAYKKSRPRVLYRDENACVKCGSDDRIEVHHVNGYSENSDEYLQTLCYSCHLVAPMGTQYWEWKANGKSGPELVENFVLSRMLELYPELNEQQFKLLFMSALAVLAEFERDLVSERTTSAMAHKRSKGERVGTVPFGFDLAANGIDLAANAAEQSVLVLVNDLRAAGETLRSIAAELTRRGIPTKGGNKAWSHTTVQRILKRAVNDLLATAD